MTKYDRSTVCLAVFVSILATLIGINNLLWFTQLVHRQIFEMEKNPNIR
ncbi:hypothetical protein NSP_41600 [Nodularia spumigena CCY9414]|nr:hypothetical protein NSP_41600 [Nodularia spumigena CCY9414]